MTYPRAALELSVTSRLMHANISLCFLGYEVEPFPSLFRVEIYSA